MTIHFASWWIPLLVTLGAFVVFPLWWARDDPYGVGWLFGMVPWGVISVIAWAVWGFLK